MEFNQELSRDIAKKIWAKRQTCYYNAFRALEYCPGGFYVEGYVVVRGFVIEHGWIEFNGAIVDPTLPEGSYEGDDALYIPGLRFSHMELLTAIKDVPKEDYDPDLPIFYRYGWGGMHSPEMRTACKQAWAAVGLTWPAD